jgi:predicted outer membrane repeat protein
LTVDCSTFIGNSATGGTGANNGQGLGGAIFVNSDATASTSGVLFSGNTAADSGGSPTNNNDIYGTLTLDPIIVVNTNDSGPGSLRQAILDANACAGKQVIMFDTNAYGTITLTNGELLITGDLDILGPGPTNVAVNGNQAGRVFDIGFGSVVTIAGLTISNGVSSGIANFASTLTVSNCWVTGNSGVNGGGLSSASFPVTLTVVNSTFSDNSASNRGGGIYSEGGKLGETTLMVVNSTLSHNSAPRGGGIFIEVEHATAIVNNSTLSDNSATTGGGIFLDNGLLKIGSTILKAGSSGQNINILLGSTSPEREITSLGYNLSSDDGGGFLTNGDHVQINPELGPLQFNGGPTPTHALLCGSPAIDAGTNFSGSATDQRGFPRTFDNPGIPNFAFAFYMMLSDGTDIGAYELVNTTPVAWCKNATLTASSDCTVPVKPSDVDNGSYDPDGDTVTMSVSPAVLTNTGPHTVALTVTDCHGASSSCPAMVTVVDSTPPNIISCAPPVTNSANASCQANVPDFTTNVVASDNCTASGALVITQSPSAGLPVGLGTFSVTVYVADAAGKTNTCATSFTVVDKTPPNLVCPSNQVVNATGPNGAAVTYAATATDNCSAVTVSYSKLSGSTFPIGDTTVNVSAKDAATNISNCSFNVHVKAAPEQINDLIASVNALPGVKSPNKQALISPLQSVLGALAAKNKSSACSTMQSFINLVNAQMGKKLITGDAGVGLINDANRIRKVIGCS